MQYSNPGRSTSALAFFGVGGKRTPKMMRRGLLPHWAKDEKIAYSTTRRGCS